MIPRLLQQEISEKLFLNKAIILLGARQVGKTTLLKTIATQQEKLIMWLNADEIEVQELFDKPSATSLRKYVGNNKILIIDEAQRIKNIGLKLKLITDQIPQVQLIATGSSAFELPNEVKEPLTGRKWEYQLYPLSFEELVNHHGLLEEKQLLKHRLLYGYYPDVVTSPGEEKEVLKQLTDSYLYKDILMWQKIQKPEKLVKLLQALSHQIGNQVSYNELSQIVGLDNETVEKYISLLEKTFIIYRLGSYSKNLRSELKRSRKIYFYDVGIRNAIIANFQQVNLRQDIGALWENFIINERLKYNQYHKRWVNQYFWEN